MEEDQDTIAKHIAKAFSKGHVTEQTNLKITILFEEQGIDGEYRLSEKTEKIVSVPADQAAEFIFEVEKYLITYP